MSGPKSGRSVSPEPGSTAETEPRVRIEEAAKGLFSRKGYAGTGVREIAREAGVNLAMINYYFGSKRGLLDALSERFFGAYRQGVIEALVDARDADATLRAVMRVILGLLREDPDLARVAMLAHPVETDELDESYDLRAQQVQSVVGIVVPHLLSVLKPEAAARLEIAVVGPALPGLLLAHLVLRPVLERALGTHFDDAFYEAFPDKVADFLLYGLSGMVGDLSAPEPEEESFS